MISIKNIYKRVPASYHYASFLIFGANLSILSIISAALLGLPSYLSYILMTLPLLSLFAAKMRRNMEYEAHLRSSTALGLSCAVLLCVAFLT